VNGLGLGRSAAVVLLLDLDGSTAFRRAAAITDCVRRSGNPRSSSSKALRWVGVGSLRRSKVTSVPGEVCRCCASALRGGRADPRRGAGARRRSSCEQQPSLLRQPSAAWVRRDWGVWGCFVREGQGCPGTPWVPHHVGREETDEGMGLHPVRQPVPNGTGVHVDALERAKVSLNVRERLVSRYHLLGGESFAGVRRCVGRRGHRARPPR